MVEDLLLLIAAYLRKANHPTETDQQIMQGVKLDLAKIIRARAAHDVAEGKIPPDVSGEYMMAADQRAKLLEQ